MLLLSLDSVIELLGFKSPTSVQYKILTSSEFKFKFSEKTFKNVLKGKQKPSKAFIDNVNKVLFFSSGGEKIDIASLMEADTEQYISPWVSSVKGWRKSISADMFPFTQKEILRIAEIEQDIINECRLSEDFKYRIEILCSNSFIQTISNKAELNDIRDSKNYDELGKAFLPIVIKNCFYVLASLESEFIHAHIDYYKSTDSRIVRFLLPIKTNSKVRYPLQRLFDFWKEKTKIPFITMAKVLRVKSKDSTQDTSIIEQQKRKFNKWRAGEYPPNYKDIENILLTFSPDISEWDLQIGMNIYWTALFLTRLFVEMDKFKMYQDTDELIAFFNNYTDIYREAAGNLTRYLSDNTASG